MTRTSHIHTLLRAALLIVGVLVVLSAGCITAEKQTSSTEIPVPEETEEALTEFAVNFKDIDLSLTLDLYYLADQIGEAETEEDIHEIINNYYVENTWINRIIYDNTEAGKITDIVHAPTKEELVAVGGILNAGPIYIPDLGWMELMYAPVFNANGEYKGYLLFVYEAHVLLQEHDLLSDTKAGYGNYTILITNRNGVVFYATQQQYIGAKLEKEVPHNIGDSIIILQENSSGAYQYAGENTTITTAWQKIFVHKNEYTLFLTKEYPTPVIRYDDQFTPKPDMMRQNVTEAWKYAMTNGKEAAMKRINEGSYPYDIYAVTMNGTIFAASPEEAEKINLTYIDVRGSYGMSHMDQMIATARQGGGYVIYFEPADTTQVPDAGLFTIGYVMPAGEDWFIAGTSPGSTNYTKINNNARGDIVSVSRAIVGYAHEHGTDSAIEKILSNPQANGTLFTDALSTNVSDLVILDSEGTVYADSYHPEMSGKSGTFSPDVFGSSVIRKAIIVAKSGGGMIYDYQWSETKPGYADLWLYAIEPIDNNYFAFSGTSIITVKNYVTDGIRG